MLEHFQLVLSPPKMDAHRRNPIRISHHRIDIHVPSFEGKLSACVVKLTGVAFRRLISRLNDDPNPSI